MLARKLLAVAPKTDTDKVLGFLCSESGSHDYTVNRGEALEFGLAIEKPSESLYGIVKALYNDVSMEVARTSPFDQVQILAA